jgi:hypothetical protein
MSHRAALCRPHRAAAPQHRGLLPPGCPPPAHYCRKPAAPFPCGLQSPPDVRLLTPLPTAVTPRHPLNHPTNVLPKRRWWS